MHVGRLTILKDFLEFPPADREIGFNYEWRYENE